MATNLYVQVPSSLTTEFWFSTGGIIVICHMILALIAAIVAIFALALAKTLNDMTILGPSIMALLFVWISLLSGLAFLFTENAVFSYTMAIGFLLSFGPCGYLAGKTTPMQNTRQ